MNIRIAPLVALRLAALLATALTLDATAADVVAIPAAGDSFVVKDSGGTQDRLRVKETGEIWIPILGSGPQQGNLVCYGPGGTLGPCTPGGAGGGGAFTLPFSATLASTPTLFDVTNTGAGNGLHGTADTDAGVRGDSNGSDGVHGRTVSSGGGAGAAGFDSGSGAGAFGLSAHGDGLTGVSNAGNGGIAVGVRGTGSNGLGGVVGSSDTSNGVFGTSNGTGVWGESTGKGPGADGIHGHTNADIGKGSGVAGFNSGAGPGVFGSSVRGDGVQGISSTGGFSGVTALNQSSGSALFATSTKGYAIGAAGNVGQKSDSSGLIKAMVHVHYDGAKNTFSIDRCFNLVGTSPDQQNVPPCGIALQQSPPGFFKLIFRSNVGFLQSTPEFNKGPIETYIGTSANEVTIEEFYADRFADNVGNPVSTNADLNLVLF